MLVIQSQIQTLDYLRKGIELRLLEGRPLGKVARKIPFCQPDSSGNPVWRVLTPSDEPAVAPDRVVHSSGGLDGLVGGYQLVIWKKLSKEFMHARGADLSSVIEPLLHDVMDIHRGDSDVLVMCA